MVISGFFANSIDLFSPRWLIPLALSDVETIQILPPALVETSLVEASSKQPAHGGNPCGIYAIVCITTQKIYLGSSVKIKPRWANHRYRLKKGNHHSKKLQNAWAKYGAENFKFVIIKTCAKEQLAALEQDYIDTLRPFYNSHKIVGEKPSSIQYPEQTRKKWSDQKKELWKNPNYRASVIEGIKKASRTPEVRLAASKRIRLVIANPEIRARAVAAANTPENRKSKSDKMKAQFLNPVWYATWQKSRGIGGTVKFLSPTRDVFETNCIRRFEKEHGLGSGTLQDVKRGKYKQAKGWRLYCEATPIQMPMLFTIEDNKWIIKKP